MSDHKINSGMSQSSDRGAGQTSHATENGGWQRFPSSADHGSSAGRGSDRSSAVDHGSGPGISAADRVDHASQGNSGENSASSRRTSSNSILPHQPFFSLSGNRLILRLQHTGGRNDRLTRSTQLSRRRVFCGRNLARWFHMSKSRLVHHLFSLFSPRARSPWRLRSCRTPISRHVRV